MSIGRKAAWSSVWMSAAAAASQVLQFGVFAVLARVLDKAEFGLVAFAVIFANLFSVFLRLGYGDALVQLRRMAASHVSTAHWVSVGAGVAMTALCLASAQPIGWLMGRDDLPPVLGWLSLTCVLVGLRAVPSRLLARELRHGTASLCQLAGNVVGGVAGVWLALNGGGVWSLVTHRLVTDAVTTAGELIAIGTQPILGVSLRRLRELSRFSNQVFAVNLLDFGDQYLDQLLVGALLDDTKLGEYTVARRLVRTLVTIFLVPFRAVAFSGFSRLQDDRPGFARAVYRSTTLVTIVGYPLFLGIAAFAPEVLELLFSAKWVNVAPVVQALCGLALYSTTMVTFLGACKAAGHPEYVTRQRAIAVVLNVVLFLLAAPFGLLVLALAVVGRSLLMHPYQISLLRRATGIEYAAFYRAMAGPLVAAVAVVLTAWFTLDTVAASASIPLRLLLAAMLIAGGMAAVVRFAMPSAWRSLRQLARRG